jgi:hypothetical protein
MLRGRCKGVVVAGIGTLLSGLLGGAPVQAQTLPVVPQPAPTILIPPIVVVVPTGDLRGGPLHENGGRDADIERSTHHGRVLLR